MPKPPARPPAPTPVIEVVDPRWILKAGAGVIGVAFLCAYTVICVLFYHSQGQLVLHPARTVGAAPTLPYTEVHFGVDATGQPQLDGWWIPSDNPTDPTILMLHSGEGDIANAIPEAATLHEANLNVLLFDYRGFGHSNGLNPSNATMQADAESALAYLTGFRNLAPKSILVYGTGLGASLAVRLCADHPNLAALILESPNGDLEAQVRADQRSHIIPMHLLFHEQFPLAAPLSTLKTPKLLITTDQSPNQDILRNAADPKMLVTLGLMKTDDLHPYLRRFLDTYPTH
jgi:pimeloyl-ACP methyl ester carboxylesterase